MSDFPHATFRIEMAPGKRLGPGKVRLLELVAETGSISAAARAMAMSYRRAWLLIEESNALFAAPLVESFAGGTGGGGARLTELGAKVIAAYKELEEQATNLVARRLAKFPGVAISRSATSAHRPKRP
jgi:molybdate transport system regulatory protein